MKEERYLIKEAAALVGVESHVLRYWEDELKMDIRRNGMGHRYYTKRDIELLTKVRNLKEKGLQLKAIRNYLEMRREQIEKAATDADKVIPFVDKNKNAEDIHNHLPEVKGLQSDLDSVQQQVLSNEAKMEQFQQLMNRIVSNAIQENNELIGKSAGEYAASAVVTQISGMTKEQEAKAEERYRKLDQTLREIQRARLEAAATNVRPVDKRRQARLNRKNKNSSKTPNMVSVAGVIAEDNSEE
jgi:DNA-binding transcriptional MerR regulator